MKTFTVEKTELNIYYCENRLSNNPHWVGTDRIYIGYHLAPDKFNIKARLQELNKETQKQQIHTTLFKELVTYKNYKILNTI